MEIISTIDMFMGMMKPDDIAEFVASSITGKEDKYENILIKSLSRIECHKNGIDINNAGYIEHQIKLKIDYVVKDLKEKVVNP